MEEKIRQAPSIIGGLITSPSSRKEKMEANSASMDRDVYKRQAIHLICIAV